MDDKIAQSIERFIRFSEVVMKSRSAENVVILPKKLIEAEPHQIWNAFVVLLSESDYHELSPQQRDAYLVYRYESEVQNGGHLQYFENRGVERLEETVQALGHLRAVCQQSVLREAGELFVSRPREHFKTVEEFCAAALEDEFSTCDSRFHECSPSLNHFLELHLEEHKSNFVQIID